MSPLRSLKNALPALLALLAPVASAGAQMEKRWIDQ
jgi:hypothetical protein